MTLEEKIKENKNFQEENPALNAIIGRLKEVLTLNHKEKEKQLAEARSLISSIPEVEQSQIIRRLHMEKWIKVYPHLVLHMKKDLPLNYEDNRFNVTLRLALTSGDSYNPQIEKYKKDISKAKAMIEVHGRIIDNQITQFNQDISQFTKEGKCPLNDTHFNNIILKTIEEQHRKQLEHAEFVVSTSRKLKTVMRKRYVIILKNLKKMLPNRMFEDEELDLVRKLMKSTFTTIKTIDKEMNDSSIITNLHNDYVKVKKSLARAIKLSEQLSKSEQCQRYRQILALSSKDVKKSLMKLVFLRKVSAKQFFKKLLEAELKELNN